LEIRIIAPAGETPRLVNRLKQLGLDFEESSRAMNQPLSERDSIRIEHEFSVDRTLRRAVAKIAFNYAAKVLGDETIRRPEFDTIRRFVRHGDEPVPLVSVRQWSPLMGPDAAASRAHVCALGWEPGGRALVAVVSLFNELTYGAIMCRSDTDEWTSVGSRHLFDPIRRTIETLGISE
jgi:hypothetical protein